MIIPSEQANDTLVIVLSKPSTLYRFVYYGLLLMLILLVAWAYWSVIGITIQAQGSIRPTEGTQSYTALFNTEIESVYVVENQRIQRGDTLLSFTTTDLDVQLEGCRKERTELLLEIGDLKKLIRLPAVQADFRLPHLKAEYEAIQKDLRMNDVDISVNTKKFNRAREMKNKHLISDAEHEDVKRLLDLSQAKMEGYLQNKISGYRQTLFSKEAALRDVESRERLLTDERRKHFLLANANGFLCQISVKRGGVPAVAGQELVSLTPSTAIQAEFYVPAKDIGFIRNRFPVRYEIDAFPFQEWGFAEGEIVSISNDIISDARTGAQYFKVIGSFNGDTLRSHRCAAAARLQRGLSFRAIVTVAEKRLLEMLYDKTVSYFVFRK